MTYPASSGLRFHLPNRPGNSIGRLISKSSNAEAQNYFDKVKELEDPANKGVWQKKALHLSGGKTQEEISEFFGYVNSF